jgi:hypothetical protein
VPFHVTLMLADAAQAVDNKLYILGGGWSIIGPTPAPSAIALHIKVPWDEANVRHRMRLELVTSDGDPVTVSTPGVGDQPLFIESEFEVGRPPGLKRGTPIDLSIAINLGPVPLAPDSRYEWRLSIGAESHEDWRMPFSTRAAPPGWRPGEGI